jgi:ferredoxin
VPRVSEDAHGPVQSQRAGVTIEVDRELCFGFGDCVDSAPGLFALDEEGKSVVVDPESHDLDDVLDAARNCPVDAILVVDAGSGEQVHP